MQIALLIVATAFPPAINYSRLTRNVVINYKHLYSTFGWFNILEIIGIQWNRKKDGILILISFLAMVIAIDVKVLSGPKHIISNKLSKNVLSGFRKLSFLFLIVIMVETKL